MHLFNTLTKKKEEFKPISQDSVKMYVCGPTVYNHPHIGNARPPVVFDILARLLERKFNLTYVRNITDVDDKINDEAKRRGISIEKLTTQYIDIYRKDMAALGVRSPSIEPKVTDHIELIIDFIEKLKLKDFAYESDNHIYFDISKYGEYGKLSGRNIDELISGARVEVSKNKKNPGDFVLWKPSEKDTVGWSSPWGYGRPGWHIECSVMAYQHLGETIDIHGGGSDLIFPHHENEIAQSECGLSITKFANYWLHNGLINVKSEKMSKSLGNVLLVSNLLNEANGEVIRMALIGTHYRQPLDWTDSILEESKDKLDRMYDALLKFETDDQPDEAKVNQICKKFFEALEDDLNTPKALAEVFAIVKQLNSQSNEAERVALIAAIKKCGDFLGILSYSPKQWFQENNNLKLAEEEILKLLELRNIARSKKDFAESDRIRDDLLLQGISIEDTKEGTIWKYL
jgi:cysteinyl-tRNA synthetase